MRLIDADQLINAIKEEAVVIDFDKEINRVVVRDVEYVPVIRCRDCKYYEETDEIIGTCLLTVSGAYINGYCAWAERKEEWTK